MPMLRPTTLAALLACAVWGCEAADRSRDLGDSRAELWPTELMVPLDDPPVSLSKVPVTSRRAIRGDLGALAEVTTPRRTESRSYALTVPGWRLAAGVDLPLSAPGALVEIRSAPTGTRSGAPLRASAVLLTTPTGHQLAHGHGLVDVVSAAQLQQVHRGLGGDAIAFRIDAALGQGAFTMTVPDSSSDNLYRVRVREDSSDVVLRVWTDRDTYVYGDLVRVRTELVRGDDPLPDAPTSCRVLQPGGPLHEVVLHPRGPGRTEGELVLHALDPKPGVPWTVEVSVGVDHAAGIEVRRVGRTSFGYAVPTARLSGTVDLDLDPDGLVRAELPIDVAADGRYAVSAVLWGTTLDGSAHPVALSETAAFLAPGRQTMFVSFDPAMLEQRRLADGDLGAPYMVRDLRLVDQSRLGVLHRQDEAFGVPDELLD